MATDYEGTDRRDPLTLEQLAQIADLVEGVLEGAELERALRLLSESPTADAVYRDSVALLRGSGPESSPSAADGVPDTSKALVREPLAARVRGGLARPITALRAAPHWQRALPLLAAGVAALLVLQPGAGDGSLPFVEALGDVALRSAVGAPDPLGVARGPELATTDAGRAFRVGVRVVDAEAAIVVGQQSEARRAIESILTHLRELGAPPPVMVELRAFRDAPDRAHGAAADEALHSWLGLQPANLARYELGKRSQAVRFAIVSEAPELARDWTTRGLVDHGADAGLAPLARDDLDEFAELVAVSDFLPPDRSRLLELLGRTMAEAAR